LAVQDPKCRRERKNIAIILENLSKDFEGKGII
jgi:hypothetical protein